MGMIKFLYHSTIFLLLLIRKESVIADKTLFSNTEENVIMDLIKHLNIRFCYIVGEEISTTMSLSILKKISTLNAYAAIKTETESFASELKDTKFEHKTMLIHKSVKNIATIKNHFNTSLYTIHVSG